MENGIRTRENVAGMDSTHPTLRSYIDAVTNMKALPSSDPRSWEQQANIHLNNCPHGNWFFLPWHRAYILAFEKICQEMSGNPDFALPYWNWTDNPPVPDPFWQGTLLDPSRVITQGVPIPAIYVGQPIIDRIQAQTEFELFASFEPTGQDSTDPSWQRVVGGEALLERTPHDHVHTTIAGNMQTFLSPLDPIFWLHHCNIDRLWAEWNAAGNQNTSDSNWTDFQFNGNFVDPRGNPFDVVVGGLQDIESLGYIYDTIPRAQLTAMAELLAQPAPRPPLMQRVTNRYASTQPSVASFDRGASFTVNTPQSALRLAATARSATERGGDRQPRVIAFVRGVEPPQTQQVTVNVFLNAPKVSPETPPSDPHYVGNFTFFGIHDHEDEHGGHHAGMGDDHNKKTYVFDVTETLDRLQGEQPERQSQLTIQLMPVPLVGRDVPPVEIKVDGVEIVYT